MLSRWLANLPEYLKGSEELRILILPEYPRLDSVSLVTRMAELSPLPTRLSPDPTLRAFYGCSCPEQPCSHSDSAHELR